MCLTIILLVFQLSNCQITNYPLPETSTAAPPDTSRRTVKVGICAVQTVAASFMGWAQSGGAIALAIDRLNQMQITNNIDFQLYVNYTECDRAQTVGVIEDFIKMKNVDVVIGSPCPNSAQVAALLLTYYTKMSFLYGYNVDADYALVDKYPYLGVTSPNSLTLGYSVVKLLQEFKWDQVALLYLDDEVPYCSTIMDAVEYAMSDGTNINIVTKSVIDLSAAKFASVMNRLKQTTRVIILCMESGPNRRQYLINSAQLGMTTDEYVHILISMRSIAFGSQAAGDTTLSSGFTPFFLDATNKNADGKDSVASEAAKKMFVFDLNAEIKDKDYLNNFMKTDIQRALQPPINCQTTACRSLNATTQPAVYSRHLHDTFYLLGLAVNRSLQRDPINGHRNSTLLFQSIQSQKFEGLTGDVVVNANGTRDPTFLLYAIDSTGNQVSYVNVTYVNQAAQLSRLYTSPATTIWATRGGMRPLSQPICGYSGTDCPKKFWDQYLAFVIAGIVAVALLFVGFVVMIFYIWRTRRQEQMRLNSEWQIKQHLLVKPPTRKERKGMSKRSLQSGPSTMTGESRFTFEVETNSYTVYYLEKDPVLTMKHVITPLTSEDFAHFVKFRKMDHENVNKFVGLSLDASPHYLSIWRMCSRGSLQSIIAKGNLSMDPFFIFCIIRDIAEGLNYLHHSFLQCHGALRSSCCLVNDSWQVKICDHGLHFLQDVEAKQSKKQLLWFAPEHLTEAIPGRSKPGDIYSFAIICSEVITRKTAWDLAERKETTEELLYLIKKGGRPPVRPGLNADGIEINTGLLHLVRDCWSERASERPPSETVTNLLKSMMPSKNSNLMDHVFNMMEEYTTTLELEVEERTKELSEEKKKADVLLQRMLPKQVAERLKLGQTVEPEGFDSVTVFFSDVVKFTQLAAKCSPFQVVSLLNDLYSNFDAIIEEHGVYKVESIGDGYLCVSGLPVRNGSDHIKVIVEMSLDFMNYVKDFRIGHLPRERVDLRIGVNSGPCVAGVVGLSMPRYCLFGDTVNTASRMESNGKAGHIHLSGVAHNLLATKFPQQYNTQSRGDVIIKGKGVMETFWVLGRTGEQNFNDAHEALNRPEASNGDDRPGPSETTRKKTIPILRQNTMNASGFDSFSEMSDAESDTAMYRNYIRKETMPI